MTRKTLNIICGSVLPVELEKGSELLSFSDSLVFGPRSDIQHYNALQRFVFWKHVYDCVFEKEVREWEWDMSYFLDEGKKYDVARKALLDGHGLNIWVSMDPSEILLFGALANFVRYLDIKNDDITLSVCSQTVQKKHVCIRDIEIYSDIWNFCSKSTCTEPNSHVWASFCQNCPHIAFLLQCLRFLQPNINGDLTLLAKIDKELLQRVSNNTPVKSNIIVGDMVSEYPWLGEIYPFYRFYHLSYSIKAIIPESFGKRFNQVSYVRTVTGDKYLEEGITDSLVKTKYFAGWCACSRLLKDTTTDTPGGGNGSE